jgi:hypothetical protein
VPASRGRVGNKNYKSNQLDRSGRAAAERVAAFSVCRLCRAVLAVGDKMAGVANKPANSTFR